MSQLFGEVAGSYDVARPGYPSEIVEAIRGYHGGVPARLVEVGAGTGRATGMLLGLGAPMTCVEPDARMAELLAARFPGVEVVVAPFEEWTPPPGGVPALACIVRAAIDSRIDGLIVGNTTLSRPSLRSRHGSEAGGLSGAPLKELALRRLKDFRAASGGAIPLIAAGGIENGVDAYARIRAGASLVQLYTALVYQGPGVARTIAGELRSLLSRDGFERLADAVGTS
jgi:Dihydroorotate dehydrogenase